LPLVWSGLVSDYSKQKTHVAAIEAEMASKTNEFFVSVQVSKKAAMAFFVGCIYPRCMQGPDDAMFCSKFIERLHQNSTPGFGTLHFFDSLITTLSRALFCLTEGEAACASILLVETWKTVSKWRYDESTFETELVGKAGSVMFVTAKDDREEMSTKVTKEQYEVLYNKWHAAIGASCIGCLQSTEYIHLRSCLVVLTRMVDEYPTRPRLANRLLQILEPLQKDSKSFADIRASAQAYNMQLLRSRDNGVWKEEDAATVEARMAKVEAAAVERHKKAEEQMEQLKRDSDKIIEEIGVYDSRDRSVRGRGQQGGSRFEQDDRRGGETRRRLPLPTCGSDDHRSGTRPPTRDLAPTIQLASVDHWQRGPAGSSYVSIAVEPTGGSAGEEPPTRARRQEDGQGGIGRNLEGRWQQVPDRNSPPRGSAAGAGIRKRSRPSSPAEEGETGDWRRASGTKTYQNES
jgi:hypothetical protein